MLYEHTLTRKLLSFTKNQYISHLPCYFFNLMFALYHNVMKFPLTFYEKNIKREYNATSFINKKHHMFIPILLGTAREGRQSEKAANYMLKKATEFGKKNEFETELIDVRDYDQIWTDKSETSEHANKWSEKMKKADGLIIISPEYNHGYPGELKIMLDELYAEYAKKPVGICGVSIGMLGGARVVEQLRLVAIELHMTPINSAICFAKIGDFKSDEANETYDKMTEGFLTELLWYAKALKAARESA